jgi:hypothetical protein
MAAHDFETHRCGGSLEARCSIRRYGQDGSRLFQRFRRDGEWHLYRQYVDFDYDYTGMDEVARISHCPWCGKEL